MVEDVLQECYQAGLKLDRYIRAASLVIDRVVACASAKGITLTTAEQMEMESWLAAHFYTKMDPTYASRSTDGASGSFVRDKDVPEPFKDGALMLDPSGCLLLALNKTQRATAGWMGRPPSEQTDYADRD
jgi:hypothetical protein